jgi:hypothetical protein
LRQNAARETLSRGVFAIAQGIADPKRATFFGGRRPPIENDFAGSSLKIETGGELLPGIAR